MYAGLASLAMTVLLPVLVVVVTLAGAGVWFGLKALREIAGADEPARVRKRARIGIGSGLTTVVVLIALILYFNFVYETPEKLRDFNEDKPAATATSTTEAPG
jgi:hypothetical protein